jgi:hypothetical protein
MSSRFSRNPSDALSMRERKTSIIWRTDYAPERGRRGWTMKSPYYCVVNGGTEEIMKELAARQMGL